MSWYIPLFSFEGYQALLMTMPRPSYLRTISSESAYEALIPGIAPSRVSTARGGDVILERRMSFGVGGQGNIRKLVTSIRAASLRLQG